MDNTFCYNLNNVDMLREVTVKIKLKRIDTQECVIIKRPIEYMVEVNIYYQGHREITEINIISGQK